MKKWKRIYELFKQSNLLDSEDLEFIKISEEMLATNNPICEKIVYSELWLSNWIKTTNHRIFAQQFMNTVSAVNIEVYYGGKFVINLMK
jgi:hypothetical protein